jgi:RecA-family ATPase
MPNYQNGKIYCIRSHQTDKVYIGSTCSPLYKRLYHHKKKYKNEKTKINYSSFEIIQYEDAYIELLEEYPSNNRMELNKKEGEYIRNMNCVNKKMAGRTHQEVVKLYYQNNKEKRKEYHKEYRGMNKEKLKEKNKQYREDNKEKIKEKYTCPCGSVIRIYEKSRHIKSSKHKNFENNILS